MGMFTVAEGWKDFYVNTDVLPDSMGMIERSAFKSEGEGR
jgi:hypothetical protein